jgi:hypothetical protein
MAKHELLTQKIIAALANGPRNKVELRNEVVGKDLTCQAFYKAFAALKAEEVITTHKSDVSLSVIWLGQERKRVEKMASSYRLAGYQSYFGNLGEGKKLSFRFKTLRELDLFWTHVALVAAHDAKKDAAILSFLPHDYFDLLRPVTSDAWFKLLGDESTHANVVTHAAPEEKRHSMHSNVASIETMFGENPLKQGEGTYITIIGDLIFQATLDASAVPGIRRAMRGESADIEKLVDRRGVFKLSIARSRSKATTLKKRAQKYFSLPLS